MMCAVTPTPSNDTMASNRHGVNIMLDLGERAFLLVLFGWLVVRILVAYAATGNVVNLILLPSEGLVIFFILIRRTTKDVSRHPADWLFALLATMAPLAVQPSQEAWSRFPLAVAATVMFMGLFVQVHAKLVLGRSMGLVAANRGLKFSGPYRFVRHPMYFGYLLGHVCFLTLNPTLWNFMLYTVCYSMQVPRLLAEERLLRRDSRYVEYARTVRYRLVPGLF
jgi:protein-S-isoprenylcysteine O-methyltransferase Ste14